MLMWNNSYSNIRQSGLVTAYPERIKQSKLCTASPSLVLQLQTDLMWFTVLRDRVLGVTCGSRVFCSRVPQLWDCDPMNLSDNSQHLWPLARQPCHKHCKTKSPVYFEWHQRKQRAINFMCGDINDFHVNDANLYQIKSYLDMMMIIAL